jgi:hypothetical protein
MDLDDCGEPATIESLLDVALCRNDLDTAQVLLARQPPGQRFSLEPWLRCLPAREIGGPIELRQSALWLLIGLGGTLDRDVENAAPTTALTLLGWPELAQTLATLSPSPAAWAADVVPHEEGKRFWLNRRLASIAGEEQSAEDGDVAGQAEVIEIRLGHVFAPQYLLSGACGNVNCTMTFFGTDQGRYRILLQTAGYEWKLLNKHGGLAGLDIASRASATTHCQTQYAFDGTRFSEKRCFEITDGRKHLVKCPPCR